ncbi:hypothetical protein [uncultured Fibrobacter sp.]|uniref:hypothetical protein n=1 Tax=uncultured Fibrobacter sp. TaxID=261512 RepID=UPI0026395BCD|nr:hypothetical protein [uncultured Fibrobacter sp.]
MKKLAILLCLVAVFPVFAGKVITYTAVSNESQEDANNMAMAGIAKQISSQVNVNQQLSRQETTANGQSTISEKFLIQDQVKAFIKIKGATITPIKVDKGFKATATLDLDVFTADIQFKLQAQKKELADLQTTIAQALDNRQYASAIKEIERGKEIIQSYGKMSDQLGQIYPIDKSYLLEHNIPDYESRLQNELSQIRIEGPAEPFTLSNPEMPPWIVTVYDRHGPVANFPLVAKQKGHILLERRTSSDGSATFKLRNVNIENAPYVITIEPNLPGQWLETVGLRKAFEIPYSVSQAKCRIRIQCSEVANICNALEKKLAKKSIFIEENPDLPSLEFKMALNEVKQLKINANTTRYSYTFDYMLKGKGISFITTVKENGKTPTDATIQAIDKIDFTPLQQQLRPFCNH